MILPVLQPLQATSVSYRALALKGIMLISLHLNKSLFFRRN